MTSEKFKASPLDFESYFCHKNAGIAQILPFAENGDHIMTADKVVEGNEFIKEGDSIGGEVQLKQCLEVTLNHVNNSPDQCVKFTREEADDKIFNVKFGA